MRKDQLFLLPPAFPDPAIGPGTFHCVECARLEGLLGHHPALIALLGEPHQNCPTLVVGSASPAVTALVTRSSVTNRDYCAPVVEFAVVARECHHGRR
jgi:hypothetical protein